MLQKVGEILAETHGRSFRELPDCENSEERFMQLLNREKGNLTGYDCPECLNRGFFWGSRDGYRFMRECKCMEVRKSIRRIEKSGLKTAIEQFTFTNFECREPWQQALKSGVKRFVSCKERDWLLLAGQRGAGKSHLCTAAAGELLRAGVPVVYLRWVDDGAALKAGKFGAPEDYRRQINAVKGCKALYIDDLFKGQHDERDAKRPETVTDGDIALAFEILNHRYVNRLTTIISTERTMQELFAIDSAIGSRIFERTKGFRLEIGRDEKKNFRVFGGEGHA